MATDRSRIRAAWWIQEKLNALQSMANDSVQPSALDRRATWSHVWYGARITGQIYLAIWILTLAYVVWVAYR